MFFKQVVHQDLGCASYVIGSTETGECAVVDPRWEIEPYLEIADQNGFRITHVIETHNHADHVSGHGRLAKATGAGIAVYETAGVAYPHRPLHDTETIDIGEVRLHVIHTPGHRPEHIALAVEDRSRGEGAWMVLTGDTLFVGDVARPDLAVEGREGAAALFQTLRDRLLTLPDYAEVYPGHVSGSLCGRVTSSVNNTTIGYERRFNQALRFTEQDEFVQFMNENLPQRPPNMSRIVEMNRGPLLTESRRASFLGADAVARYLEEGAVALDVRRPETYLAEHIPGSVHVAYSGPQFGTRVGFVVPADGPLVLVVNDETQAYQADNSLQVVAYDGPVGYTTVESWKASGRTVASTSSIDPQTLHRRLMSGYGPLVLDVREKNEWEEGHVESALHIPYRELPQRASEVPRDREIAVICDAGSRSVVAASLLERSGITEIVNVSRGISGWRRDRLPEVTRADRSPAGVSSR